MTPEGTIEFQRLEAIYSRSHSLCVADKEKNIYGTKSLTSSFTKLLRQVKICKQH